MKTEECDEQDCYASDTFEIVTPCSAIFRLDLGALISLKAATRSFCQTRREECGQKDWSACRKFGIIIPFSVTYFLEVGARVLFKSFLEVKNLLKLIFLDYFSKEKRRSGTKKIRVSLIHLKLSSRALLHIIWTSSTRFAEPPKLLFEVEKLKI